MQALDEKAKRIGLSRSEAVRKAVKQWAESSAEDFAEQPAATEGSHAEGSYEKGSHAGGSHAEIIERLDRIESRIMGSTSSQTNRLHSQDEGDLSDNSPQDYPEDPQEENSNDGEDLRQMQRYEGEDLLNWIDSESEKIEGSSQ